MIKLRKKYNSFCQVLALSALIGLCITSQSLAAQGLETSNPTHRLTLGTAFSFKQLSYNLGFLPNLNTAVYSKWDYPAIFGAYEYRPGSRLSIGLAYAQQSFGIDARNEVSLDDQGNSSSINYNAKVVRTNIGVRSLFYWQLDSERLELYTGARLSVNTWAYDVNTSDKVFYTAERFTSMGYTERIDFGFQIIPIGVNAYLTDHLGLQMELALGAPHVCSLGIIARL